VRSSVVSSVRRSSTAVGPQRYAITAAILGRARRYRNEKVWTVALTPEPRPAGLRFDAGAGKEVVITISSSAPDELLFDGDFTREEIESLREERRLVQAVGDVLETPPPGPEDAGTSHVPARQVSPYPEAWLNPQESVSATRSTGVRVSQAAVVGYCTKPTLDARLVRSLLDLLRADQHFDGNVIQIEGPPMLPDLRAAVARRFLLSARTQRHSDDRRRTQHRDREPEAWRAVLYRIPLGRVVTLAIGKVACGPHRVPGRRPSSSGRLLGSSLKAIESNHSRVAPAGLVEHLGAETVARVYPSRGRGSSRTVAWSASAGPVPPRRR